MQRLPSPAQPLPPTVWRLGWISFLADVASDMAYPVLPLFLKSLGAPAAALGAIEGLADATANVMKGVSGVRSDRQRKRAPYIRWGYGLSALGKPLIALATAWPLIIAARVLDRFGKGIRTSPRDALLADVAPKDRLGAVFGLHRGLDTAGALVGVLIALGLLQLVPGNYRLIFVLAFIPGLASLALAFTVKDPNNKPGAAEVNSALGSPPQPSPSQGEVGELGEPGGGLRREQGATGTAEPNPNARALTSVIALHGFFAIANTSDTFLLLRARDLGFSESAVIGTYLFYNVAYAALSYPAGRLSDRLGRWPVIAAGWLTYAAVYAGFAFASETGQSLVWLLFLGYGVYVALTQGVAKAQVAELAPAAWKGASLGRFYVVSGLCALAGNLAFGLVWDRFGSSAALLGAAGVALLAVLAIPLVRRR